MSGVIGRFEDFVAWQKARALAAEVYQVTDSGRFARDYSLRDQVRRTAVSIACNIAEGFERGRPGEFQQFFSIAKGSCAELRTQLYVALDVGYLDRETFDAILSRAEEVGRVVGGLRASAERRRTHS